MFKLTIIVAVACALIARAIPHSEIARSPALQGSSAPSGPLVNCDDILLTNDLEGPQHFSCLMKTADTSDPAALPTNRIIDTRDSNNVGTLNCSSAMGEFSLSNTTDLCANVPSHFFLAAAPSSDQCTCEIFIGRGGAVLASCNCDYCSSIGVPDAITVCQSIEQSCVAQQNVGGYQTFTQPNTVTFLYLNGIQVPKPISNNC